MANGESQTGIAGSSLDHQCKLVMHCQQKIPQRLPFLRFPFFIFSRGCWADCMGWVGRGGSSQISFQPDLGAVPAHHTAVHRVHPLQGSDRNVQMRGSWTHPQQLLIYPSSKAGVSGPCLLFPAVTVQQNAPSLDRLHPNSCLYSRAALKSWGCRGFQSQCRQTTGTAIPSLVDPCGTRSLPRQTGPGPGHTDIWLVCGSGAGCQGQAALQLNPSWNSATGL